MALSTDSSGSRDPREKITIQNVSKAYESTHALADLVALYEPGEGGDGA